jgi:DNA processing protein
VQTAYSFEDDSRGKRMSQVAVEAALSDDQLMPRRAQSRYVPPKKSGSILLSEALRGTDRFPGKQQLDFLGTENRADLTIFYAGDLSLLKLPSVAIVGTRQVSKAGTAATEWLTRKLVDAGFVIVSGLAYGVDTVAHTTAINHAGKTIGVIGTPLEKATPSENAKLQEQIYREYLLISRFPKGDSTFKTSFPLRNRLMAVLSDATIVMEASDTSGTLHQAAECTKLGRWLFMAKAVVDDPTLTWPKKFLKYETCVTLDRVSQVTDRLLKSSR